jgi:hypothetical protein
MVLIPVWKLGIAENDMRASCSIFNLALPTLGRRFVDIPTRKQGLKNLMLRHILCRKPAVWTNVLIV